MKRNALILAFFFVAGSLGAQQSFRDVIYREHGVPLTGRIVRADATQLQCEIVLKEGQPVAQIALLRSDIKRVIFAGEDQLHRYLKSASLDQIEMLWQERKPLLNLPESPTGSIGLAFAELLLKKKEASRALGIFQEVESGDWNPEHRAAARLGRLRALLALDRSEEAVAEARALEKETADPALLIEAKYILAESGFLALQKLLEENPRWKEDEAVIPQRNRLYHETLDLYLYPYLFHGAVEATAARGLWRAVELHQLAGETKQALEAATDIATLYPTTPEAVLAKNLQTKPN